MKKIVAALIGSSALALSACGSSTDDAAINLGLTVVDSAGGRLQPDSRFRLDEWLASPDRFSGILSDAGTLLDQEVLYSTGADLESLKLYIYEIKICDTEGGTPDGCLTLFTQEAPTDLLNTMDPTAALTAGIATTDGYIDLLDETSRAQLAQSVALTEADARTYVWGVVSFAKPIKATATLHSPGSSSTVLSTQPVEAMETDGGTTYAHSSTSFDSSGAEESTFLGPNSVSFTFQQPLEITADAIASGTAYNLKLAFNPQGVIQGLTNTTNEAPLSDGSNLINIAGGIQLAPIFYQETDTVMRETYVANVADTSYGDYDLRLEFYYLASDPERTIYGINMATVPNASSITLLGEYYPIKKLETAEDGTLVMTDSFGTTGEVRVKDFVRADAEGDTAAATLVCPDSTFVDTDCAGGAEKSLTFTLETVEAL